MVARTGSVVRSSEELHRAQSAITHAIKELEVGLGVRLFERRTHGMLLTEFGRVLLVRANKVFREMELARQGFDALGGGARWNPNAPIFVLGIGRQRLLLFVELLKQCHIGAVADSFGVSQPAVSQALREVERGVGLPLVTRSQRGIVPNRLGELLAVHLRRALAEIRKAEEEIESLIHGITGQVVVGTLSQGRNRLLPRAIIQLVQAHPAISVTTIEGSFEHLATLLRAGEIDFIFGGLRLPEQMAELSCVPVATDRISVIVRRGHPFCAIPGSDLSVLESARWVLPRCGTWTRTSLEACLAAKRLQPPHIVVETADVTLTRGLLLDSDLITAASPNLFKPEIETGELVVLPLALPSETREIGIVQRNNGAPAVAAELLMAAITDVAKTPSRGPTR